MLFNPRIRFVALAALVSTIALRTPLAAAADAIKPSCSDPRDYGELVHCFLEQFRCLPDYFGVDGKPDYAKALKCFEAHKSWRFVALAYVNGEGAPRDLKKAAAALKAWQQQGLNAAFNEQEAATLKKAISRCGRRRQSCARVDFCRKLALSTRDMEICGAVEQVAEEAAMSRAIAETRSKLSRADRPRLDRAVADFKAYQLDDMQRQYQGFIDASLRDIAGAAQAAFVREDFLKLVANTVRARNLAPATASSYDRLRARLSRKLAGNLSDRTEAWREALRDPRAKEWWARDRAYIEEYRKAARESQLQWIKLRDSCARLASSLYRGRAREFDPALSMKAAITRLRIAEIGYDPLGPP